jgi:hypothetical protein
MKTAFEPPLTSIKPFLSDVTILETFVKLSKLISHIHDTSKPSAILSFKTNNNSFSSSSSFRILRLTFAPVGFFAKFIIVEASFI